MNDRIRCGDTVLHKPSGERWVVAYADYESDALSWFGWPEGRATLSDCERVHVATDERHAQAVSDWLDKTHRNDHGGEDHRVAIIRRLYRPGA